MYIDRMLMQVLKEIDEGLHKEVRLTDFYLLILERTGDV